MLGSNPCNLLCVYLSYFSVDPLYRLEHQQDDKRRAASKKTALTRLTELSDTHGKDDYSANARLRKVMRERKKVDREREKETKVIIGNGETMELSHPEFPPHHDCSRRCLGHHIIRLFVSHAHIRARRRDRPMSRVRLARMTQGTEKFSCSHYSG